MGNDTDKNSDSFSLEMDETGYWALTKMLHNAIRFSAGYGCLISGQQLPTPPHADETVQVAATCQLLVSFHSAIVGAKPPSFINPEERRNNGGKATPYL